MFSLLMFGSIIERVLGSKRFINYYLICGIGALVLQYGVQAIEVYQITGTIQAREFMNFNMLTNQVSTSFNVSRDQLSTLASIYATPLVGASGAIYGVLLAFGYLFPNMTIYLWFIAPVKAKYLIAFMILVEIYLSISSSGGSIAHLAHVGGALFGFILLKVWNVRRGTLNY